MSKPKCYDLFCGLGGWSEAFIAEGYRCVGFDIEAHDYGTGGYPGELILRDIRSIHGSELADATIIVASPPCQAYSYRAMPWSRAKTLPPPDNTLFNECFRIQREAIAAAGHYIPLIVENVRGAQKWVGRARWNYGSFYLWGDVPALMPITMDRKMKALVAISHGQPSGNFHGFEQKVPGFRFDGSGKSFQSASVEATGVKVPGLKPGCFPPGGLAQGHIDGTKQGGDWFGRNRESSMSRMYGSKSSKRKAASAMIAKIPYPLAQHIARSYYPRQD